MLYSSHIFFIAVSDGEWDSPAPRCKRECLTNLVSGGHFKNIVVKMKWMGALTSILFYLKKSNYVGEPKNLYLSFLVVQKTGVL